MEIAIITALLFILLAIWIISVRQRLKLMDEALGHDMNQIGVQLSCRFDMLSNILDIALRYKVPETRTLQNLLISGRRCITAISTPQEVLFQERLIKKIQKSITDFLEEFPKFQEDDDYQKFSNADDNYAKMLETSKLLYNDSAQKLNDTICKFPTFLIAGLLGFQQQDYLK